MNRLKDKIEAVKRDFQFNQRKKDIIKLKFLNNISKTPVWISKKTGLIFHNEKKSSDEIVKEWSTRIFSKKMDAAEHFYTDSIPEMKARHFYVLEFMNQYRNMTNKKIFDFACGQGGLLTIASKYFSFRKIGGVEYSKKNIANIKKIGKKNKFKKRFELYNSSIEKLKLKEKADIGFLTWTLCNCIDPLSIISSLKKNIKKDGFLIVAESSRLLVPFKKIINNYFVSSKKIGHTHPWHWSKNSLVNIFKIFGFKPVKVNRFHDVNDLVIIFKNSEDFKQQLKFDNYKKVISFLKRWKHESKNYKFN